MKMAMDPSGKERSWAISGPSWVSLGQSWGHLGAISGRLETFRRAGLPCSSTWSAVLLYLVCRAPLVLGRLEAFRNSSLPCSSAWSAVLLAWSAVLLSIPGPSKTVLERRAKMMSRTSHFLKMSLAKSSLVYSGLPCWPYWSAVLFPIFRGCLQRERRF